ncbi:MAG: glycine--tRNA ligase, partial [Candidatus Liptonbacteria bacterium]|nr:glycine--tRNA ligase [Candidatus Liptonbacteria bacterium]
IDAALIMNPKVWEASGHLKEFSDPLVECKKCHARFRADTIDTAAPCTSCGARDSFTNPAQFNLMLKTFLGPAEETANTVYFRPETAQGMFVNFGHVLQTTRRHLPFGIAQSGKAFRNEITPGNFIFRTREFEQMEIEYFIAPPKTDAEWQKHFEHWRKEMVKWMKHCGLDVKKRVHELDIPDGERAHYSKRTIDFEYDFPFGTEELYGLAYRTDFDLKNHAEKSGADLQYTDPTTGEKYIPHVIEPTWGVDRTVLAVLVEHYHEEEAPTAEGEKETRVVMKFPFWLAPYKAAVLPLSKKPALQRIAKKIHADLRAAGVIAECDETQSIGKRYRRQDEIGTPFCITVDFDSIKDKKVTVRDRDTMKQKRVAVKDLTVWLVKMLEPHS